MKNGNSKSGQTELAGMPTAKGAGKVALEWLAMQNRINGLEDEKEKIASRVLAAMEKEKRQVMNVKCPDTNSLKEFKLDPGHLKLRVRKLPEKVGKNT